MVQRFRAEVGRFLEPILPKYLALRIEDSARMSEALDSGDFATLKRLGHSMKGSGGSYDLPELSRIGAELEIAAKRVDCDECERLLAEMRAYLDGLEIVYVED